MRGPRIRNRKTLAGDGQFFSRKSARVCTAFVLGATTGAALVLWSRQIGILTLAITLLAILLWLSLQYVIANRHAAGESAHS